MKAKVQIFSRMDRTNWPVRALLYSHNQHLGFTLDKMILYWIIMTMYASNSFSSIFIRILPEYFPVPLSHLKRSFHSKNQNLLKKSLSSILFVYWCRPSIFGSNTPSWRSNTALDGPLINQSNRLFLSGYTIMIYIVWRLAVDMSKALTATDWQRPLRLHGSPQFFFKPKVRRKLWNAQKSSRYLPKATPVNLNAVVTWQLPTSINFPSILHQKSASIWWNIMRT